MNCIRRVFSLLLLGLTAFGQQSSEVTISMPKAPPVVGPILKPFHFERRVFSPANLTNKPRLARLASVASKVSLPTES